MVEQHIYEMIQSKAALTALIGTRVNPVKAEGQSPYIRYEIVDEQPNQAKNRTSKLDFVIVDFYLYAATRIEIATLRKTFREQIDGHSDSNLDYVYFQDGQDLGYNTETDLYEYQQEYKLETKR